VTVFATVSTCGLGGNWTRFSPMPWARVTGALRAREIRGEKWWAFTFRLEPISFKNVKSQTIFYHEVANLFIMLLHSPREGSKGKELENARLGFFRSATSWLRLTPYGRKLQLTPLRGVR